MNCANKEKISTWIFISTVPLLKDESRCEMGILYYGMNRCFWENLEAGNGCLSYYIKIRNNRDKRLFVICKLF